MAVVGDDIALDISQSSGAASPEETGRGKRKRTQTKKSDSNGAMEVLTGGRDDVKVPCKDQQGEDSESLVLWRWQTNPYSFHF